VVVADAADYQVLTGAAEDHVVVGAPFYPVAACVAVEGILATVTLYEVTEGG